LIKPKVLVTGAAGFIGSNLTDFLLNKGFKVYGLDNFLTGNKENINHLANNPDFEFIESDVTKFINIKDKLDYVLHFASPASPIDYLNLPIQTLKANAIGGHNALGIAKKNKAKFLLASTSEVYGDPLVHPQNETYYGNVNPIGPRSIYDEAKRFIESMTIAYHKYHNLNVSIVRIFNTYGPRMRINDGRVLPNFIYQASNNLDVTINGDGNQTRSFCYIDDLILGIYSLLKISYAQPINLGNDDEVTINEVAKILIKLTKSKSKIVYKNLPDDDPIKRKPDLSLAKQKLNWAPKVTKEEGFNILIDYYNSKNLI
jgi:dTDP-glucose 4,6-dehydratase